MTSRELRNNFLEFFEKKGHKPIPSASLIPENDPTALFISAGMQPLVLYLLGEKHPLGRRLVDVQKCIRTDDIDEVGDACHHTFFEMLGNWSLGDPDDPEGIGAGYFKEDSIKWSYEFLTDKDWLGLDKEKLAFSVFAGDENAPFDQEAYDVWISLGMPEERIAKLPRENNWWGPGETGPCGPDTEMFYWTGIERAPNDFQSTCDDPRWVEIWNNVFIQFNCKPEGKLESLRQKNVDTGMGLERTLSVINGLDDNYKTDLFAPIIKKIEEISGKKYEGNEKEFRIIADHLKAAAFAISDGAAPSNKGAGYIVRRLIRRAILMGQKLGISKDFTGDIAKEIFKIYDGVYFYSSSPEGAVLWRKEKSDSSRQVSNNKESLVLTELAKEEDKFRKTLAEGLRAFDQYYNRYILRVKESRGEKKPEIVGGKFAFDMFQSFGFPLEMTLEEMKNRKMNIAPDSIRKEFEEEYKKHQELSRTASAGMFRGGLSDTGEETKKLHTAAHLLLAALRSVLGDHVYQKGSNITAERLRFDFSYPEKMTPEQIKQVEDLVNAQIEADLPVVMEEMTLSEAKETGATGVFESKYGEKVKVYSIGRNSSTPSGRSEPPFSREICGGPHAACTGELGHFKILKEESSSAGVRRIKAIL